MTRIEQIEEAIRVRPSRTAMAHLRGYLEAMDACSRHRNETLAAGALRILIEMHDKLPPPEHV